METSASPPPRWIRLVALCLDKNRFESFPLFSVIEDHAIEDQIVDLRLNVVASSEGGADLRPSAWPPFGISMRILSLLPPTSSRIRQLTQH